LSLSSTQIQILPHEILSFDTHSGALLVNDVGYVGHVLERRVRLGLRGKGQKDLEMRFVTLSLTWTRWMGGKQLLLLANILMAAFVMEIHEVFTKGGE